MGDVVIWVTLRYDSDRLEICDRGTDLVEDLTDRMDIRNLDVDRNGERDTRTKE